MPERSYRIHVLALRDCAPIVPVGVMDLLRKSIELAPPRPGRARKLEVSLVAPDDRLEVACANGLVVRADLALRSSRAPDLVVVPALDPDVLARLDANRAVVTWLRRAFANGSEVASVCTGAFLLAEAGLLDHRKATTHWAFQELLASRYPKVRVAPQAIIVDQGRVITSGGATSFINLVLFLVERLLGQEVAWAASRMFLIDPNKAPQGAYAAFSTQKAHADAPILRAQEVIEGELARAPSVDELARRVALSRRTFSRRFIEATGNTPRDYIQRVRVEAAKRALERGETVGGVANLVGYGDPIAFRKLFARVVGLTPAEYRVRYGPRARPAWEPRRPARRLRT